MAQSTSLVTRGVEDAFEELGRFLSPPPALALISGPSGVGKDSVIGRMRELGHPFDFVVTATDRAPRPGEVDGQDYLFVSTAEFERMISEGELFEHALVYGQYKGVPKVHARRALASGLDVIMRLDVQGVESIRGLVPGAVTIFIAPPSRAVLLARLRRRAGDSTQQLQRRVETALAEMSRLHEFDYVVVNHEDRLEAAVSDIAAIVKASKLRLGRAEIRI